LGVEEAWGVVEGLAEMEDVVGGGTALVTPVPNLPEFKICNAGDACQKESDKRQGRSKNKVPSLPAGSGDQKRL
jgi:hypothetical protein